MVGLTISGSTAINGFGVGLQTGGGSLSVAGTVSVTGNVGAGIRLLGLGAATSTVTVAGATISGNGSDGIEVDTSVRTTVQSNTLSNNHGAGIEVIQSQNTDVQGYQIVIGGLATDGTASTTARNTITGNWGNGVLLTASGKVGARLEGNTISTNGLEGIRVTQSAGSGAPAEVLIQSNSVSGNLTRSASADEDIVAGGVNFADEPELEATSAITLGTFLGNRVFGNARNQIGFNIPQAGGAPWNLSSQSGSVDMALVCSDSALPNFVYCYGVGQLGVAVTPNLVDLIKVKGMHWQTLPPAGGRDFSSGIPTPNPAASDPDPTTGIFLSCSAVACPQ
jgi:parallel beta-helix repeat protein